MFKTRVTLSAFLIAGALAASAQAEVRFRDDGSNDRASLNVDVGFFYDELEPYGSWREHDSYGPVWTPRSVASDWQPYRSGRWVDSDYGWTWDSDEPFGWATYHYGRWAYDPDYGWIWVPGTDWGPAWVAWQEGGDYIGWAPLPPSVGYSAGIGLRLGGINLSVALAPTAYVYVEQRSFLQPRLSSYCLPRSRNADLFRRTRNITRYGYANQRLVNYGVPVERIERVTQRRVQRLRVATAPSRTAAGIRDNELRVFRPAPERLRTVRVAARNNAGLAVQPRPSGRDRVAGQPAPAPRNGRGPVVRTQEQQQRELVTERQRQIAERNREAAEQRERQRAGKERPPLKPRPVAESKAPAVRQVQPPRESAASVRAREQRERQEAVAQREARRSAEAQRNAQRQSEARERQAPKPVRREAVRPPAPRPEARNADRTPQRPPRVDRPEPRRGQAGGKPQANRPRQKPHDDGDGGDGRP